MENTEKKAVNNSEFNTFFFSTAGRLLFIGVITFILLIPLVRVNFLIQERKDRSEQVREGIINEWGGNVSLYGLVLRVPEKPSKKAASKQFAFFYPEISNLNLNTTVSTKKRNIFSACVFDNKVKEKVIFKLNSSQSNLDWSNAQIGFVLNASARLSSIQDIEINGKAFPVALQDQAYNYSNLLFYSTVPFPVTVNQNEFQMTAQCEFTTNGSEQINLPSLAKKSFVHLTTNWSNTSFQGNALPSKTETTSYGRKADFKKLNLSATPDKYHLNNLSANGNQNSLITFSQGVDHYQLNERTVKYAILVIVLTFCVFILIELVGKVIIHPLHYLFIGLGLILFYSLLLSLSEQLGFNRSYIIASSSIILLISWYAKSILNSFKFAITCGFSLSLLYVFLLVIVNLETYALIVGSIGLFAVLFAIMSFTRRLKVN